MIPASISIDVGFIHPPGGVDALGQFVPSHFEFGNVPDGPSHRKAASLIHFLASPDASYRTVEAINVDGGWVAGPSIAVFERRAGGT